MAGQLDRLLMVSGLPNVTLGIIPLHAPVRRPDARLPIADDVTYVETHLRAHPDRRESAATPASPTVSWPNPSPATTPETSSSPPRLPSGAAGQPLPGGAW
jgi:hypothetical protein